MDFLSKIAKSQLFMILFVNSLELLDFMKILEMMGIHRNELPDHVNSVVIHIVSAPGPGSTLNFMIFMTFHENSWKYENFM